MKSAVIPMFPFDSDPSNDEEVTAVVETLGSLVTRPATAVELDTPLDEVRLMLVQYRVPAIAVIDEDDNLRGLITRTDVLRTLDPDATAADAMSGYVFALPATASIEHAAALMAYEGVGQIVVTNDGELAGIVSAVDIVRHIAIAAGYLAN